MRRLEVDIGQHELAINKRQLRSVMTNANLIEGVKGKTW